MHHKCQNVMWQRLFHLIPPSDDLCHKGQISFIVFLSRLWMGRSVYLFNTLIVIGDVVVFKNRHVVSSVLYVWVSMVASIILFCASNCSTKTGKAFFFITLWCHHLIHLCDAVVFAWMDVRVRHISYEKSFNMFVQHAILTTVGEFSTDKNCTPESKTITFKNTLSPCTTKAFKCLNSRPRV